MHRKMRSVRRGCALFLALVLCAGLLQLPALAAEENCQFGREDCVCTEEACLADCPVCRHQRTENEEQPAAGASGVTSPEGEVKSPANLTTCTCGAGEGEPHGEDCPLYVKPETLDGDDGEGAPECTCNAEEGESHAETCPLYVKLETPDGDDGEGAPECTCNAEEVEPHAEDCPLYVKPETPDGDDGEEDDVVPPPANALFMVEPLAAGVAAIGTTEYATLQEAIDAGAGQTVTLLESTTENITIAGGQDIVLNIPAGLTLSNSGASHTITVNYGGKLTVTGAGFIANADNKAALFNSGEVMLSGATITCTSTASERWYLIVNHGDMTIEENGKVIAETKQASMIQNGYGSYTSTDPAKGFVSGENHEFPTLTITGGTVQSIDNTAIKNEDGGVLDVSGNAKISGNAVYFSVTNFNTATISGGEFTGPIFNYRKADAKTSSGEEFNSGILVITGGRFINDYGHNFQPYGSEPTHVEKIQITGGTFGGICPLGSTCLHGSWTGIAAVAPNYKAVANGDGTYTVKLDDKYVARIIRNGETFKLYDNLQDAVTATQPNDIVELLRDAEVEKERLRIGGKSNITLDGNGHTITQKNGKSYSEYGVQVYGCDNITLRDLKVRGSRGNSLHINAASVIIEGTLDLEKPTVNVGYGTPNASTAGHKTEITFAPDVELVGVKELFADSSDLSHAATDQSSVTINPPAGFYRLIGYSNRTIDWVTLDLANSRAQARIGDVYYCKLADAIKDAVDNDIVYLLKDVSVSSVMQGTSAILIDKNITLDGGNHKIYYPTGNYYNKEYHGIQAYGNVNVELKNLSIENYKKDALLVNGGATVTATNLNTAGNTWGAVNVDHNSKFTFVSGSLSEDWKIWTDDENSVVEVPADWKSAVLDTAGTRQTFYSPDFDLTLNETAREFPSGSEGQNFQLTPTLAGIPLDADNNPLKSPVYKWTSSDTTVAAVDAAGRVTVVGPGTATITASSGDEANGVRASCAIEVKARTAPGVTITPDPASLTGGGLVTLTVTTNSDGAVTVTCPGVAVTSNGDGTWTATLPSSAQTYTFTANVAETAAYSAGSDSCEVSVQAGTCTVTFNWANGGTAAYMVREGGVVAAPGVPAYTSGNYRYTFTGWTPAFDASAPVYANATYIAQYSGTYIGGRRGGGSGGGSSSGGAGTTTIEDPGVPLAGDLQLNREDHFAYIKGYEDGTIRPNNHLTRAQVVTIYYRLLTDLSRELYFQETNDFTDVPDDFWACKAISTLTNAGVINGFQDGTFRPNAYITRAQFAAMTARFESVIPGLENPFADVSESHWARDEIAFAASQGWVSGGGSFRPQENITRVETMEFINNVLDRHVDGEGLLENAVTWSDVPADDPNYYVVEEAANSHGLCPPRPGPVHGELDRAAGGPGVGGVIPADRGKTA